MNKEDYVSFEVAKLLKNKGFNWKCHTVYDDEYSNKVQELFRYDVPYYEKNSYLLDVVTAPSLYVAQKWLREEHHLHVDVGIANDCSENADGNVVDSWDFWCYDIYYTTNFSHHLADCKGEFESYEEA